MQLEKALTFKLPSSSLRAQRIVAASIQTFIHTYVNLYINTIAVLSISID